MKTITTHTDIYKFDELTDEAKENAIENYRKQSYEWGVDIELDWYKELIEAKGFDVDNIYYSHSCSQGDGLCFTGNIDTEKLIDNLIMCATTYEEARDLRALEIAIYNGLIDVTSLKHTSPHYYHEYTVSFDWSDYSNSNSNWNATDLLEQIEEYRAEVCQWVFKMVQDEIDYQYSDEYTTESIEINEYDFLQDGSMY